MGGAPSPSECSSGHDLATSSLTLVLLAGLLVSYMPQLVNIMRKGTSEGFSPWYLLLGATSSASGMLNILIVQWQLFRCCQVISGGDCAESLLGFVQVTMQWFLFSCIVVLYFVYFPPHLKYQRTMPLSGTPTATNYGTLPPIPDPSQPGVVQERYNGTTRPVETSVAMTAEWRNAIIMGGVVTLHLALLTLISLALLYTLPPTRPPHPLLQYLATFLGISGTALAIGQYAPQIYKTYRSKLVGALSLGTMAIQCPGSILFILSLAFREGVNWTSWMAYAVTAAMQGALLVICLLWKRRQRDLGIDDFGRPLSGNEPSGSDQDPLLR